MDEELRLEISKIVSLARPESILPNLNPTDSSSTHTFHQSNSKDNNRPNTSQKRGKVGKDPVGPPPKQIQSKPLIFPTVSKKSRKYQGMKASELHFRIQDDKIVDFCQEHNLIAKKVVCACGNLMVLESKTVSDGCEWTCFNNCHTAKPHQTIRKGTWFENSKLPIADILWIAYMWVHEYSPTAMLHECGNSNKTLIAYCLDVCRKIMEHKRYPIGGEGKSIEIFECKITKDKKPTEKWAFCGIEQCSTDSLELLLDNKKSKTLFQIFDKYFLAGSKVVTHNWTPFKNLNQADFVSLINDKSISFFDVVTKKSMDIFQDFKRATNRPPPGLNKWSKLEYGPSFFEKMYRKSLVFAPDAYLTFLNDISKVYKPVEKLVNNSSVEVDD